MAASLTCPTGLRTSGETLPDDTEMRTNALERWTALGPQGQEAYQTHVYHARTKRGRRDRALYVLTRLVNPDANLTPPATGGW